MPAFPSLCFFFRPAPGFSEPDQFRINNPENLALDDKSEDAFAVVRSSDYFSNR